MVSLRPVPTKTKQVTCKTCGKLFETWYTKKYCSKACRPSRWRLKGNPNELPELHGMIFDRLYVEGYAGKSKWECTCECGKTTFVYGRYLLKKITRSCGCLKNDPRPNRKPISCKLPSETYGRAYQRLTKLKWDCYSASTVPALPTGQRLKK